MRNLHSGNTEVTPSCGSGNRVSPSKGGRPRANFNVAEAYALRQQGWRWSALGDKFNVDEKTIRTHLKGYKPPPVTKPPAPAPVPTPVTPLPVQVPVAPATTPVVQPAIPEPAPQPLEMPQPIPVVPEPVAIPEPPVRPVLQPSEPPPLPYYNAAAVIAYWQIRGIPYEVDRTRFFLVHEQSHVDDAANRFGLLAVAIEQWHPAYAELDLLAAAKTIWVLVADASDKAWLQSLVAADSTVREKMRVAVGDIPKVFSTAMSYARVARSAKTTFPAAAFEQTCNFRWMPQQAGMVESLFHSPEPPPPPNSYEPSLWETPYFGTGYMPPSGKRIVVPPDSNNANDGSGVAF